MTKVVPHVTEEPGWETEASSHSVAKAFVVLLVLHIVGVGGMLIYTNYKKGAVKNAEVAVVTPVQPPKEEIRPPQESNLVPSGISHVVVSGETPDSIAAQYKVPVAVLIRMNQLDTVPLQSGMALRIPKVESTHVAIADSSPARALPDPVPLPTPSEYPMDESAPKALVPSDQFEDLAPNTPPPAYANVPKAVPVPEKRVVEKTPEPEVDHKPTPVPETPTASGKTHTLRAGDTAYAIARKYGVSVSALLSANGIKDPSALQIGRVLKIPTH